MQSSIDPSISVHLPLRHRGCLLSSGERGRPPTAVGTMLMPFCDAKLKFALILQVFLDTFLPAKLSPTFDVN